MNNTKKIVGAVAVIAIVIIGGSILWSRGGSNPQLPVKGAINQSAITLLSPVKDEVLKEGTNTLIKWNIENLPSNKSNWSLIGSVRCGGGECGKTGLQIFSYPLSDNLSKINWKVVSPAEIDKFRGPNKIDYRNYGLDAKSISSSIVVCLVQNGAEEEYAMGFLSGYNFSCSKELPVTVMFNPPLSF